MMNDDLKNRILTGLQRYCAIEERSEQKIREKLYIHHELTQLDQEEIIDQLRSGNFLDENRFVEAYIRSKVNQNKWGRLKIRQGLHRHRISENMIEQGLCEIDDRAYRANLASLLAARKTKSDDAPSWIRFLLQRGYEYSEILEEIGES